MSDQSRVVPVEIHGQRYPIRSTLDEAYVARLAAFVDERIRAAADSTPARRGAPITQTVIAGLEVS